MKRLLNSKGQSMVEVVLILPILLLVLMGIFDFGRILHSRILLENSARFSARVGTIENSDTAIADAINDTTSALEASQLTTTITPLESSRESGDSLTVRLTYDVPIYTPLISNIIGNPVAVEGEVTMRVE